MESLTINRFLDSAQCANYVAAQTIAGNLLSAGVLTGREVVITLLVGDALSGVSIGMWWLIPYYVGIFGPGTGMEILVVATAIRNGTMLAVIFALVLFW